MRARLLPLVLLVLLGSLGSAWAGTTVLGTPDNCTRADNNDLGANWDPNLATFKISVNACIATGDGTDAAERNNSAAWPVDQYAKATFGNVPNSALGTGYGVGCRWDSSGAASGYWLVGATTGFEIAKWVTGVFTTSFKKTNTTTFATSDTIELRCTGTGTVTLAAYKNGVLFDTETDSSSPFNTGYPAIAHSSTTTAASGVPYISAWEGGSVTFGVPTMMLLGVGQ